MTDKNTFEAAGLSAPEYVVGDTYYTVISEHTKVEIECPDCLGKGTWEFKSPAGEAGELPCPRCSDHVSIQYTQAKGTLGNRFEMLKKNKKVFSVKENTVKKIEMSNNEWRYDWQSPNRMYKDKAVAEHEAKKANEKIEAELKVNGKQLEIDKINSLSWYGVDELRLGEMYDSVWFARFWNDRLLKDLREKIDECHEKEDYDDFFSEVEFAVEYWEGKMSGERAHGSYHVPMPTGMINLVEAVINRGQYNPDELEYAKKSHKQYIEFFKSITKAKDKIEATKGNNDD